MLLIRVKDDAGNISLLNMDTIVEIVETSTDADRVISGSIGYDVCPYNGSGCWRDALVNPMHYARN